MNLTNFYNEQYTVYLSFQEYVKNVNTGIKEHDEIIKKGECQFIEFMYGFYGVDYNSINEYCKSKGILFDIVIEQNKLIDISLSHLFYLTAKHFNKN